ncbi:MAG TPA: choline-sulfatase [Candidatus Binatia bacterium]|nr:choline-sulfatase [Candidatus Binatia bacterium]
MTKRLNILYLMADQLAAAFLPVYGQTAVKAPNIEALAEKASVFDSFYCASPLCAPSRFTMMAGAAVSRIGAYDNAAEFDSATPTFAHYLRAAGYRTALAGKMHFCGPDQLHGFEERLTTDIYPADFGWTPDWENPGVRPSWYHNMLSVTEAGTCVRSNQLDFDDEVTYAARRHIYDLARSGDGRPFCLTVSWTHPHDPYANLPELFDLYRDADIPMPAVTAEDVPLDPHTQRLRHVSDMDNYTITAADIRRARRAYFASISYVDRQVGILLQALRESSLADDTVVLLTADHGDMLGERGLWYKMTWFENACRIPLIVSSPGRFQARHVAQSASHLDLLPTLAELAAEGGTFQPAAEIDGKSLLGTLSGGSGHDEAIGEYCGEGAIAPLVMIRRGRWKFVHTPSDPDQLYDLKADANEKANLAADPAEAETIAAFRREVKQRWDLAKLKDRVIDSQHRRRLVYEALSKGRHQTWDYQPIRDAGTSYMRNHLVLDDLEARTRLPRVG